MILRELQGSELFQVKIICQYIQTVIQIAVKLQDNMQLMHLMTPHYLKL